MKDADGFEVLRCYKCKTVKLAALFPPCVVNGTKNSQRCIKCASEVHKKHRGVNTVPSKETWGKDSRVTGPYGKTRGLFE